MSPKFVRGLVLAFFLLQFHAKADEKAAVDVQVSNVDTKVEESKVKGTKPEENGKGTAESDIKHESMSSDHVGNEEREIRDSSGWHPVSQSIPDGAFYPEGKRFIKGWENYYKVVPKYPTMRTKRNLRSKISKRSTGDYLSRGHNGQWRYPSNLMILLRGMKRSFQDPTEILDALDDYNDKPAVKRFSGRWPPFTNSESLLKRYTGSHFDRNWYGDLPFGSRQFMIWNGGKYTLG